MHRRDALGVLGLASLGGLVNHALAAAPRWQATAQPASDAKRGDDAPRNTISLAQWSLHRRFGFGRPEERAKDPADPLDFGKIAREEFGISQIELVNSFYRPRIGDKTLAGEMRRRFDDAGVSTILIMCDGEGLCGAADDAARATFAANHVKWLELAKALGCHSIRVNAIGEGDAAEQAKRCADGLAKLVALAKPFALSVIVENHGGLSSDGNWLVGVIKAVNDPACGTLPDFGNWRDASGTLVDPVRNVELVMPYAKAVSAKSYDFDASGKETLLDYPRLLQVVRAAGYRGAIGIEYEGKRLSEADGIRATKALLEA
ncbi:MAG: TIM barrel protein [Phycisphaera sp.]|nr:TIM barrel protein [Phycisphaera sp.]